MSASIMSYALAAALAVMAVVRALRLRTAENQLAVRASVYLLACMAITFATYAPASQAWVNQYRPDLFKLTGNCSTLTAMFAGSALVLHTRYQPHIANAKIRVPAVLLTLSLAVLMTMFFLPHPVVLTGSFDAHYAIDPSLVVYTATYASYFGGTLALLTVQFARFARESASLMRLALWTLAIAAIIGVLHNVATLFIMVRNVVTGARQDTGGADGICHSAFTDTSCFIAIGTPAIAATVALVGFATAVGALRLDGVQRWLRHRRAYRRLAPLWQLLADAFPDIVRDPDRHEHDTSQPRNLREHLTDRIIEIRDGLLQLAPFRRRTAAEKAETEADRTTLTGIRRAAVIEAAQIIAAVQQHKTTYLPPKIPPPVPRENLEDLNAEITWLEHVAAALNSSPIVAKFRRSPILGDTRL